MDERYFRGLALELESKLRRVSAFTGHGPSVGSYHEEALRGVLRSMLPDRFSVKSRFSYHIERGASNQGDIVIVDESDPNAYLFRERDFCVVTPSAVVAVIEVKTRLTKQEFSLATKTLHSFHKVSGCAGTPPTFLFAYEAEAKSDRTIASWYKASTLQDDSRAYPWCVLILNAFAMIARAPHKGPHGNTPVYRKRTGSSVTEARAESALLGICMFLHTIRKAVLMHGGSSVNPFAIPVFEDMQWDAASFQFGKGEVAP